MPQFIYVLDPMCSWCWAFSSTVKALQKDYPDFGWTYLMGGLAPDNDQPMPAQQQQQIQAIWHEIERRTGTHFNHDFWVNNIPRRSTYPACRAVIAAGEIQPDNKYPMIEAIQKAYYQDAKNPSDDRVLTQLAADIGIEKSLFSATLNSRETHSLLQEQLQQSAALGAQGFPTLFLKTDAKIYPLAYGYSTEEHIKSRLSELVS
jgi:putative protein-disulfide isomerase